MRKHFLRTPEERFWQKVDRRGGDECWPWLGASLTGGYGRIVLVGRHVLAHRFSWQLHYGDVPGGSHVLHICDQPPCVNPAHLFLGTHAQNMKDKARKVRVAQGAAHGDRISQALTVKRETLAATDLVNAGPPALFPAQSDNDETTIALWLHGRSAGTRRAYEGDACSFLTSCGKPLRYVTVGDVQAYATSLTHLATASQARKLSAVKSLLSFAQRIGYTQFNVGAVVRLPSIKATLAERIVGEAELHRMLSLEMNPRNAAMLRLVYGAGLRLSEVCGLEWRDLQPRTEGGQATIFGKGGKTRVVLLPDGLWRLLTALRGDAAQDGPVFMSQRRGHLDPSQVHRVVKAAAKRAGLSPELSAHWLRHAHASHALDRGAPIHLVQATLGHASVATTGRYLHARPNDSSSRYLAL
jgi:integrase/recombinase XerD